MTTKPITLKFAVYPDSDPLLYQELIHLGKRRNGRTKALATMGIMYEQGARSHAMPPTADTSPFDGGEPEVVVSKEPVEPPTPCVATPEALRDQNPVAAPEERPLGGFSLPNFRTATASA